MATLQAIIDLEVEMGAFRNVDLFQRGHYLVKCGVRASTPKTLCKVEASKSTCGRPYGQRMGDTVLEPAQVDPQSSGVVFGLVNSSSSLSINSPTPAGNSSSSSGIVKCPASSKLFTVQYREEEVELRDAFNFKLHLLVDALHPLEAVCRAGLTLELELHFSDDDYSPTLRSKLHMVSSRSMKLHLDPTRGLHCAVPVFFDYFHLCAVNVVVHGALTGLCQPYVMSKQPKQAWSSSDSNINELPTLESVLFNHKNQSALSRRKQALAIHKRACHLLLSAYESLQLALQNLFELLPAIRQLQIEYVDCHSRLEALVAVMQSCQSEDDILRTANQDVSHLAADNHLLWQQFLEVVTLNSEVEAYLSRKHHQQKTKRHAEAYFTTEVGLSQLYALHDGWHDQVAGLVRSSVYLNHLPPLQVECPELDGEPTALPVIFEDVYVAEDPNPPVVEQLESTQVEQEDALSSSRLSLVGSDSGAASAGVSADEVRRQLISRPAYLPRSRPSLVGSGRLSADLPAESSPRQAALVGYRKLSSDTDNHLLGLGTLSPASAGLGPGHYRSSQTQLNVSAESVSTRGAGSSASMPDLLAGVAASETTSGVDVEDVQVNGDEVASSSSDSVTGGEMTVLEMLKMDVDDDEEDEDSGVQSKRSDAGSLAAVSSSGGARLVQVFSEATIEHVSRKESLKTRLWTDWPSLRLYSDFPSLAATQAYLVPPPLEDACRRPRGLHLVVCVHGLDGNSADLRLVKTYLELAAPQERFEWLMSERNQNDTFADFQVMCDNLVTEIQSYLSVLGSQPVHVSFVAHSMGCLLTRAVLADRRLAYLRPLLWTFLSLSGPHLGTLYNTSGLVNMGIWFMQKLKKSGSLLQMALKDHPDPRHTFLYKLSSAEGMEHFRHVLLVSSPQDRYVPYHSTRIELCRSAVKDNTETGSVYMEMLANILQRFIRVGRTTVVRYDVHHSFAGGGANALIGRAAHIAVLDSEVFLEKFVTVSAAKYFNTPPLQRASSSRLRTSRSAPSAYVLRRGVLKKTSSPSRFTCPEEPQEVPAGQQDAQPLVSCL